jgi:hypothetical protein
MLLILEVLVDISNTDAGGMVVQDCNPGVLRRSFTTAMLPRELYLPQCPFSSLFHYISVYSANDELLIAYFVYAKGMTINRGEISFQL